MAVAGFIGVATLASVAVPSASGAASVRPADAGAPCTFSVGSQSTSGTTASPGILTGVNNNSSLSVTCNGLNPADSYGLFETSPLAVVTQPFNLSVLGSEADIVGGINTLASPNASGTYTGSITVGTSAGGGFSPGGNLGGGTSFAPDPNAVCPPSQAEINAGLSTCIVAIANITATTAPGATPSQADFAGEALLDFTGQGTPQSPPTVGFNPPLAAAGHSATLSDAGASTNWWAGGWWAGGYPNGSLNAAPYSVPASNVLLNGSPASGAQVQVNPAVYCFYGGSSSTSCNSGTADTPGAGVIFPSLLTGTVPIPAGYAPSSATISIYEPNVWGSVFPGNNTSNSSFPANDLTATGTVGITKVGYWEVASDGGIFSFGTANYYGSMGGKPLSHPIVGMAATPDGGGYWEVASDGGVFAFGDAQYYGSMGGKPLSSPIVGITSTADGGGYWEVASDGGVFAFGDAHYFGSMGGKPLAHPVVGIASTPGGNGYWEVDADGGVFAFPDAQFFGSMGGKTLNKPVVGIAPTPDGSGYWEAGGDGGIFTFGEPNFFGSMGGKHINQPVVGVWSTSNGQGYWETAADGGIFNFGNAPFLGSTGGMKLSAPVVGGSIVPVLPSSAIALSKSTTSTGYAAAGDTIPYSYLVTNSGATALSGVSVSDNLVSVSCPSTTLAKGASETCSGTYTVTQADVDSGSVTNNATASANGPHNASVSSTVAVLTVSATGATSSLSLAKATTSTGYTAAGDIIPYTYTVTNTGTTTLNSVSVTDSATNPNGDTEPVTVQCPGGNVAPGASEVCTANYSVSQDDVDFGSVTNTASATAFNPAGAQVCPQSANCPTATTTVDVGNFTASLSLVTTSSSTFTASGQTITYTYTITNTGTISQTEIGVVDEVPPDPTLQNPNVDVTCPDSLDNLAPGQQETCTGTYTTTDADVTAGSVTDGAQASGFDVLNFNQWNSNTSGVTIPLT